MSMASPISATFSPSLSNTITKPPRCSLSSPPTFSQTPKIQLSSRYSHLGLSISSPWSSSKHLGTSFSPKALNFGRNRSKSRLICASLFGVGAPEALVIGVVALLVFGPKGLAEVARNLGKTLRAFQPTIRELQDVSREFKSTLEREIGLDDIPSPTQNYSSYRPPPPPAPSPFPTTEDAANVADPNGAPSSNRAYTTEDYLKLTEEQIKAVTSKQQEQTPSPVENPIESQPQPQVTAEETPAANQSQKPESETRNPVEQNDRSTSSI